MIYEIRIDQIEYMEGEKMKRKIIYMLAMFIMLLGFSTLQTNAATITNASNLNMPKANYTGTFTENNNSARYYKFTVTTPGCMKVDLVAEFYQRILLLSSTGDELKSSDKDINDSGTSHQEINYYL